MQNKLRYPGIDWFRGFSILLMVIYHACYDLDFFGYIDTAFGIGYWIPFRYVIVIGFLLLVGISAQFVHHQKVNIHSMIVRSKQLFFACLAVTASSYFIAPDKLTIFGILQLILVASWLALIFVNRPVLSFVTGTVIFYLGHVIKLPAMMDPWIHWIGLAPNKLPALDYAPIFPWFGVVLWGITFGHLIQNKPKFTQLFTAEWYENSIGGKALITAGKHSLIIYLVHQPLLFGLFWFLELVF